LVILPKSDNRRLLIPFEESEVAQAFRGFHDRGLGGTRPPAELVAGAVVVDDQIGQLISPTSS
jgi:hypothetical protein